MDYLDKLLNAYEPTEEDIKRKLTDEQLVKLCRRTRCRVDLWKWNSVGNVADIYRADGRFEGKSQKFINKLMLKTYHRNPEFFKRDEEERNIEWYKEWTYRKKKTLMQLELWQYDEESAQREPLALTHAQKHQHQSITSTQEEYLVEKQPQKAGERELSAPIQVQKRQPVTSTQESHLVKPQTQEVQQLERSKVTQVQKRQHQPVTSTQEQYLVENQMQIQPLADLRCLPIQEVIKLEDFAEFINVSGGELFSYVAEHTETDEQSSKANLSSQKQTETEDNSLLNQLKGFESESISISSQTFIEHRENLDVDPIAIRLSQLMDSPPPYCSQSQPCSQSEPCSQSQPKTYDDFHHRIPNSSTQELFE